MLFFKRKKKITDINTKREENASGKVYEWLGLEPLKYIPLRKTHGSDVITARLRGKPQDYSGKTFTWDHGIYRVNGVEWHANRKFVALKVDKIGSTSEFPVL